LHDYHGFQMEKHKYICDNLQLLLWFNTFLSFECVFSLKVIGGDDYIETTKKWDSKMIFF
jgi:hypothetical protein